MICLCRDRLGKLKAVGDPMVFRAAELTDRPAAVKAAEAFAELAGKSTASWKESKPWLNATELQGFSEQASNPAAKKPQHSMTCWLSAVVLHSETSLSIPVNLRNSHYLQQNFPSGVDDNLLAVGSPFTIRNKLFGTECIGQTVNCRANMFDGQSIEKCSLTKKQLGKCRCCKPHYWTPCCSLRTSVTIWYIHLETVLIYLLGNLKGAANFQIYRSY